MGGKCVEGCETFGIPDFRVTCQNRAVWRGVCDLAVESPPNKAMYVRNISKRTKFHSPKADLFLLLVQESFFSEKSPNALFMGFAFRFFFLIGNRRRIDLD